MDNTGFLSRLARAAAMPREAVTQLAELEQALVRFKMVHTDPVMVDRCMTALRAEMLLSTTLPTPNWTITQAFDKVYHRVMRGNDPERTPAGELTDAEKLTVLAYTLPRPLGMPLEVFTQMLTEGLKSEGD